MVSNCRSTVASRLHSRNCSGFNLPVSRCCSRNSCNLDLTRAAHQCTAGVWPARYQSVPDTVRGRCSVCAGRVALLAPLWWQRYGGFIGWRLGNTLRPPMLVNTPSISPPNASVLNRSSSTQTAPSRPTRRPWNVRVPGRCKIHSFRGVACAPPFGHRPQAVGI